MDPSADSLARGAGGSHAGQWGLAAILLGSLVLLLTPLLVLLMFAAMLGAYTDPFVESRDIDLGLWGSWLLVGGVTALALFSLVCGVLGLAAAMSRKQPLGLSLAGTVVALAALSAAVVVILAEVRAAEWTRWFQMERFDRGIHQPAPPHPF